MPPPVSVIVLRPRKEYLAARFRRVAVPIVVFVTLAIAGSSMLQDIRQRKPLGTTLFLFGLTTVIPLAIVLPIGKFFASKSILALRSNGTIEWLGAHSKKFAVGRGDQIVIGRSPDGKMWVVASLATNRVLGQIPFAAFPQLQQEWSRIQSQLTRTFG